MSRIPSLGVAAVGILLLLTQTWAEIEVQEPDVGATAGDPSNQNDSDETSPPKIIKQSPSSLIVDRSKQGKLECEATGVPAPTYRWERNGTEVTANRNYFMDGGNLMVRSPNMLTDGVYRCFATNLYGVAVSSKIEFLIAYLGSFKEQDRKKYIFDEGAKASIPCNNNPSLPRPSVYWTDTKSVGNKITLDNRVSVDSDFNLHFSNLKLSDAREYQCNVKNEVLRIQRLSPIHEIQVNSVTNIVQRPPMLVFTPPTELNAFRTEKLTLKCVAEGYPTPDITWSKEGESLPEGRTSYTSYNQQLNIADIVAEDAGTYTCVADNGYGQPTHSSTTVLVKATPYWENSPEDTSIVIGDDGEMICQVAGIPLPQITWFVNGMSKDLAEPNERRTITEGSGGGRIEFRDAQTADNAVFMCVAINEYGEISASGFLNVEAIPAELTNAPILDLKVIEGTDFQLTCAGQGSPKPVISWEFKGQVLEENDKYSTDTDGNNKRTTSTLVVSNPNVNDTGDYKCSISNGFGSRDATSKVTVRMKTKIISIGPNDPTTASREEDAIITCEVDNDVALPAEVTWFRDVGSGPEELTFAGTRYKHYPSGSDNLKIMNVQVEDSGEYTCKAATLLDETEKSVQLVVQTVPVAPTGLTVTARSDSSNIEATLSWTANGNGNAPITSYRVFFDTEWPDVQDQHLDDFSATPTEASVELEPYVTYQFTVVAVNSIGMSEPSEQTASYKTNPAAMDKAPDTVDVQPSTPGKMTVSWPEVHPFKQMGPGFMYVVEWREQGGEWSKEEIVDYTQTSYEIQAGENYEELDVRVSYVNNLGPGPVKETSGFTGEGIPKSSPQNVKVVDDGPNDVIITWDEVDADSINGKLQKFLIYSGMVDAMAQGQTPKECLPDIVCRVGDLVPNTEYEFQVSILNGQHESPKSAPVTIKMPEGPSDVVTNLVATPLSDRIYVRWGRPLLSNGVITAYNVSYVPVNGVDLGVKTEVAVTDRMTYKVSPADPETEYRIEVIAINKAGGGRIESVEVETRAAGEPPVPALAEGQIKSGLDHINVTFLQSEEGPAANKFYVRYREASAEDDVPFKETEKVDILDSDTVTVGDLERSTEYKLRLVSMNDAGSTQGAVQTGKTSGAAEQAAVPIHLQAWFIALIIIIIALLCILLVLCILKSQRGGKYNVSDKEQQRKGDIESTPLKDNDGFPEFEPRKDNPDGELPRGSQGSLQDSEPGSSDTDSLKEYADGELGKFNEEGSFIGQYGDKKRPTEDGEGGAAYSTFV